VVVRYKEACRLRRRRSFPIPHSLPSLTVCLYGRYLRHYFGAFSGPAADFQVAAEQGHPLTHAGEAKALARPAPVGGLLGVEIGAPVPYVDVNSVVQEFECDHYAGRRSVLADVGEGLLRHPEERRLHLRRQALVPQRLLVVHLAAFVADLLDLQSNGGAETEVIERGGPQVGYDLARIVALFIDDVPPRLESLRRAVERKDTQEVEETAHLLKGGSGYMGAVHMLEICIRIQELGISGDLSRAPELLDALEKELALVHTSLKRAII